MKPQRCQLCGRKSLRVAPIAAEGYPVVCMRCLGVVQDRAENAVAHTPLLPNKATWR